MDFNFDNRPGKDLNIISYEKGKKPLISIITAAYKINYDIIYETAKCVLNQTYPHFEWIIVNDGSVDNDVTKNALEKLKKLDDRIKVFHSEKNNGLAHTRDIAIEKSAKDSKYLFILDSDDLIEKELLEKLLFSLVSTKSSFSYCDTVRFQGDELLWKKDLNTFEMKKENSLVATALIDKNAYFEVGGYELREKGVNEDWYFWLKLFSKEKKSVKISDFDFWYRINEYSELAVSKNNKERAMMYINKAAKNVSKNYNGAKFPNTLELFSNQTLDLNDVVIPKYKTENKIPVLIVIPWITVGGADKFIVDLLNKSDSEKYEFTVVSTLPSINVWKEKIHDKVKAFYDLNTFLEPHNWATFIKYLIISRNIKIVFNTNSTYGYSLLPYIKNNFPKLKIIDYVHMEEWYNRNGGFSRDSGSYGEYIDLTLTCNKNSENILRDYFKRDPKTLDTVYIGVDENEFDKNKINLSEMYDKYNIPRDKKIITLIARIDYQKRPYLLVEIMKRFKNNKDIVFVIGGDGPLLTDIKSKSKKLNTIFLGNVKNPKEVYAISDLTLNCSIKEGLALTAYESLSMGVPVISSDVGGQKELINEKVGVIVPCLQEEKDIHDLSYSDDEINPYVDGINKILENLDTFKNNARERILNGFTINHMVKNMDSIFEKYAKNSDNTLELDKTKRNDSIVNEIITLYHAAFKEEYDWLVDNFNKDKEKQVFLAINKHENKVYKHRAPLLKKVINKLHLMDVFMQTLVFISSFLNLFVVLFNTLIGKGKKYNKEYEDYKKTRKIYKIMIFLQKIRLYGILMQFYTVVKSLYRLLILIFMYIVRVVIFVSHKIMNVLFKMLPYQN